MQFALSQKHGVKRFTWWYVQRHNDEKTNQVRKWCALIEGALYFLREGWLGDFIFTGIMITSFFNFFFKFYRINRSESVKMWIWYNFVIFLWPSWILCECEKNLDISFFIMHEKALYFYVTEFYKRVSGTLLIDGVWWLDRENTLCEVSLR